jgi:hypothetical protein
VFSSENNLFSGGDSMNKQVNGDENRAVIVSVSMKAKFQQQLHERAQREDRTISAIMRRALMLYLGQANPELRELALAFLSNSITAKEFATEASLMILREQAPNRAA